MMKQNKIKKVYEMYDVDKEQIRSMVLETSRPGANSRSFRLRPMIAVCASLMLALVGVSGYTIAEEAREYREAVEFFDEYRLSTEGLTRSEIKAIYKDISGKTYSYEKTVEILNSFHVEMYSTSLESIDRASLESCWNDRNSHLNDTSNEEIGKIRYDIDHDWTPYENEQGHQYYKANVIKYEGNTELWRYTISFDFMEHNTVVTDSGVIVYGGKDIYSSNSGYACALMISDSGELLWEYFDAAPCSYYTAAVMDGDEIVLFGSGGSSGDAEAPVFHTLFTVLDMNGEIVRRRYTESDIFSYCDAAVKVGDVYLIKQHAQNNEIELLSISKDGEKVNKFTYSDNGITYLIQDIYCYDNKVYLSALKPNFESESFNDELNKFLEERYKEHKPNSSGYEFDPYSAVGESDEELSELYAKAYTAVLLVCDNNVDITKAYSVENARAGKLGIDDNGHLTWQVLRIDDMAWASPYISCCRWYISATEFSFVFSEEGKLIETHEIGAFRMAE